VYLDLSSFGSVRECARRVRRLVARVDVLLHNAGCIGLSRVVTEDGLELTKQVNFLGPFLLTRLLWGLLKKGREPRVIVVNSVAHQWDLARLWQPVELRLEDFNFQARAYQPMLCYSESKLASLAFVQELAHRCASRGVGVTCLALHPGITGTDILVRDLWAPLRALVKACTSALFKTNCQAAQTSIYLAAEAAERLVQGGYYENCRLACSAQPPACQREQLWALGEEAAGQFGVD
jgi:NAD(P)-dependent dehydrogenase (short-subunit alcohol dehydrogenase family)